ncbi:WD domain-containing protein [Podospora didyma]|uniref:WD domain-containing protein n=1 Tax=Podospora didyma TaxID=330526 RepID=A0AAE0KKL6_9PEZI|nr:WD domain-containing protein [Podospora didyma]
MLAEIDGREPSNGTMGRAAVSNGSGGRAAEEANGSHKSETANGSSLSWKGPDAPPATYFGYDREEVTRILLQTLTDMGYQDAAISLSKDSGYELESPTVAAFRTSVLDGSWARAEDLLSGAVAAGEAPKPGNGLVLAPGADHKTMRFWLRQQKFLELLEKRDTTAALVVLRNELTPLCEMHHKLSSLSTLLMCQSAEDLKEKAGWDGARGRSRHILLSELSRCIAPSVMLPERRLAVLLRQVDESQVFNCLFHTSAKSRSLYSDHQCDRSKFPTELLLELDQHIGEVWQLSFSHDGRRLASCGMGPTVFIWEVPSFKVLHKIEAHENDVCNLAWSPDDRMLITCGKDRYAKIWNTETGACIKTLERFEEPVSSCVWAADGESFVIGSFDKAKSLCQWNLDGERLYTWTRNHRTEDVALSPDGHWLVAMDEQMRLHVYNFITRELEYLTKLRSRATSVSISQESRFLLVNMTHGEAQVIEIATRDVVQNFHGHTGGDFTIRSAFGGADESFVVSGSEDGAVYIWHKYSGTPVERMEAHQPRCNAVSWNPTDPCMLASCGDDGKIKIWSNKERVKAYANKSQHPTGAGRSTNGGNLSEMLADIASRG